MNRSSRFSSDTARSVVITAIMAGVLIGSLGLAYALTVQQHRRSGVSSSATSTAFLSTRVGDLELGLPASWNRSPGQPNPSSSLTNLALFIDPTVSDRQLVVGLERDSSLRDPATAFRALYGKVLADTQRQGLRALHQLRPIETGAFSGVRYTGLSNSDQGPQLHLVAVISEDARRYWVVYLRHTISQSLVFESFQANDELLTRMLDDTTSLAYRAATAADFQAVDLPAAFLQATADAGMTATTRRLGLPQEPIRLTLADPNTPDTPETPIEGHLQLRVRGEIDTGIDDPTHPLSPTSLLAQRYEQASGQALPAGGVQRVTVESSPTWLTSQLINDKALIRHVCYARIGPGRGILIEAVADLPGARDALRSIEELISVAVALHESDDHETQADDRQTASEFEQAITRGVEVAKHITDQLPTLLKPGWRYGLILKDGLVIGGYADQAWQDNTTSQPTLRGRNVAVFASQPPKWVQLHWQSTIDGTAFSYRWQLSGGPGAPNAERKLDLEGQKLTLSESLAGEQRVVWSIERPRGYVLPIVEERWPADPRSLTDPGEGAVIWAGPEEMPPSPHWAQWVDAGSTTNSSPPIPEHTRYVLFNRPLMEIDGEYRAVDHDGDFSRSFTRQLATLARGGWLQVDSVDREQLLEELPQLQAVLPRWEQRDTPGS